MSIDMRLSRKAVVKAAKAIKPIRVKSELKTYTDHASVKTLIEYIRRFPSKPTRCHLGEMLRELIIPHSAKTFRVDDYEVGVYPIYEELGLFEDWVRINGLSVQFKVKGRHPHQCPQFILKGDKREWIRRLRSFAGGLRRDRFEPISREGR